MGGFRLELTKVVWALCALLAVVLPARSAAAFDESMRPVLREMSRDGVNAYLARDYPTAVDKLERAWSILPTAPIGLWSARALQKSGQLVAASERYLEATRAHLDQGGEQAPQEQARADATEERKDLLPRIPSLRIDLVGAEPEQVELSVAGRVVSSDFIGVALPVDPGRVEVSARAGERLETTTAELAEGEDARVTLRFVPALPAGLSAEPAASSATGEPSPAEARPSSWQRPVGWIGIGLGAAGLALGTFSGISLISKYDELGCSATTQCVATADEAAAHNTWRTVSTTSLIAGGVLAALGVTLVVTAPKGRSGGVVTAYLTGSEFGLAGRF